MTLRVTGRHNTSQRTLDFSMFDVGGGLNIAASPQEIADNELTIATNGYLDIDGGFFGRNGFTDHGVALGTAPTVGLIRFYQEVLNGVAQTPPKYFTLAQSSDTLLDVDRPGISYGGANGLATAGTPSQAWQVTQVTDPNHGLSPPLAPSLTATGSGSALTAGTYRVVVTYVNGLGETIGSAETLITITAGQDIAVTSPLASGNATAYNTYVTAVGGAVGTETKQGTSTPLGTTNTITTVSTGAGLPSSNTALAATDVLVICTGSGGPYIFDGTTVYTPTNWANLIGGAKYVQLINGILWFGGIKGSPNLVAGSSLIQSGDGTGPEYIPYYNEINVSRSVKGLGVIGDGAQAALAVGMTQGISLIIGTGPTNFDVVELPSQDGVTGYRTMITVDGILYYLGGTAIYRCDGYSITPISPKIKPWLVNDPRHQEFPMTGDRNLSFATFYNQRIYFWYDSGGVGYCNTAVVWDLNRHGWTVYTSAVPIMSGCLINAPGDANPPAAIVGDAVTAQVYNFETNGTVAGSPPSVWPASDAGHPIFVQAQSKFFKLGDAGTPKTLLRTQPELFGTTGYPLFGVATNYGSSMQSQLVVFSSPVSMIWGTGVWGTSTWSTTAYQFVNPRLDWNIQAEAFAFSFTSRDTNPPWKWVGMSGTFSQLGKA